MKKDLLALFAFVTVLSGCASVFSSVSNVPPEFNQKIILQVDDSYQTFQASRSVYDVGDLQAFHSQHTLPMVVEGTFNEIFGSVELKEAGADVESGEPEVPAVFEVKMLDLSHDIYLEAEDYRSEVVLAVAMKSPRGKIFWQQSFRGNGYALADTTHSIKLGPQDAVIDAIRDALSQMKKAIVNSPEVRLQLQHYQGIQQARKETEAQV